MMPTATKSEGTNANGAPIRVALADDTEDIRRLLRMALELEGGFEIVGEAGDGEAAVRLVDRERPDAIVLDLAMPVMDGLQAIPLIREGSPLTRIVVLSGFNTAQMASETRALGADAYLEKGTAFHDVAGLLRQLHQDEGVAGYAPPEVVPARDAGEATADAPRRATPVPHADAHAPTSVAAIVAGAPDLATAFEIFAAAAAEIVPFDRASFSVATNQLGRFKVLATAGDAAWRLPVGALVSVDGELRELLGRGIPWVVADTATRDEPPLVRELRDRGIRSFVSIPIVMAGGLHAVVSFSSLRPGGLNDGATTTLSSSVDEIGAVLHVLALLDEERQASRRLRDLDRLRNDFVGMVAHDLRSPITVIAGIAECLERRWGVLDDEQKLEFVGSVARNIQRLTALVEDVLTVAHIQSGEFQLDLRPLDLGELLHRVVDEIGSSAPERAIVTDVSDHLPPVHGNVLRQRQVITNLVSNALKFSPPGQPVTVSALRHDGVVEVSVRDHGIGIAPDDLLRLFERFYRTEEGRRHDHTGTGLGLYICKSLVESWGGTIRVDSNLGTGSTFTYTSPLAVDDDPTLQVQGNEACAPRGSPRGSVGAE